MMIINYLFGSIDTSLVYTMSKNNEKCPSQVSRMQCDVLKLLVDESIDQLIILNFARIHTAISLHVVTCATQAAEIYNGPQQIYIFFEVVYLFKKKLF